MFSFVDAFLKNKWFLALVGLTIVRGTSGGKYARKIDVKKILFFGRLPKSCLGGPVKQTKINKTHTDFSQKPSRRETSNWSEWDKDQAPKSNTPFPQTSIYIYIYSSSLSSLRQIFRSGPWEDGLQKKNYSSGWVKCDILQGYAIWFTNNLICSANFQLKQHA